MSNKRSKFSSKTVEDFLKDVKDISYVLDGNSKINLTNEYQYTDLLLLYEQNVNRKEGQRVLFYKEKDKDGEYFIRLTSVGAQYIKDYDMFYEHRKHDIKGYGKAIKKATTVYSTDSNDLENNIDDALRQSREHKKKSKNLREIIEKSQTSDFSFQDKSGELITIVSYKPQFYQCDDFSQFRLSRN
jgi:hypothetical protein